MAEKFLQFNSSQCYRWGPSAVRVRDAGRLFPANLILRAFTSVLTMGTVASVSNSGSSCRGV